MTTKYSLRSRFQHQQLASRKGFKMEPYPKEYRAWIICRIPVWYPPIPMIAGGIHVTKLKKRMIRETSRSLRPYTVVPRAPVGNLSAGQ